MVDISTLSNEYKWFLNLEFMCVYIHFVNIDLVSSGSYSCEMNRLDVFRQCSLVFSIPHETCIPFAEILFKWRPILSTWWRHQMEIFSALLALCAGNSPVTGEFHAQRPVMRNFDVFFDLRLNKLLGKQSWDGDLRRYRAYYDVTVMITFTTASLV